MVEVLKPQEYNINIMRKSLDDYIPVSAFAKACGVSIQMIHKSMSQKRIKDFFKLGSFYVINKSEISKFKEGMR